MFKNYLKIAWRNLLKNKVTGFINIIGLVIGMTVAMLIGLWVQDELSYNKYHKNYDQVAQMYMHQAYDGHVGTHEAMSLPWRAAFKNDFAEDFKYTAMSSWNNQHLLTFGEKKLLENGILTDPDLLKMLSLNLIAGTYDNLLKDIHSIVLSESIAKVLFADENPVGKIIKFDTTTDLKVTGVFEDLPDNCSLSNVKYYSTFDYFLSRNGWANENIENWKNHSFQLFVQKHEHQSFEALSAKIQNLEKDHVPAANPEAFLFPMSKWHLHSQFDEGVNKGGRIQFVWLFGIVGIFVLLLACINFMNLSTARSEKRAKEVGIRKAVGSLRSQLIWQFLTESFLITFLAMLFSTALVQVSLTWFNNLADKKLVLPMDEPIFWFGLIGFTFLTGLISGSYPAFYLSSFKPITVLKGSYRTGRWASLPRLTLVTIQFTVSVALIIGTLVVYQQINHAKNRPVGYDREGIIQFLSNNELRKNRVVFRTDLLNSGAIEEASYSTSPITDIWSNQGDFEWEGKDPEAMLTFGMVGSSAEFGKTVQWEISHGRDFSREFATDSLAFILNESAVLAMGLENPVGQTIKYFGVPYKVIGVIKDIVMNSPWTPIKPTIFNLNEDWISVHTLRLKEGVKVKDALAKVEKIFAVHSPSSPFDYQFIDDKYESKFRAEERIGKLSQLFAFLAIFISCLGLFGLSAFVAEQKTKEIGIRKVLGASITNLWAMQSKSFVSLVILASFIAAPIAWYFLDGWLDNYEYRIELNWVVFVLASFLALVVTLITVSYQSIRAALANPSKSLRSE